MRTIIFGRVTADHLQEAELFAGIIPTEFVTNGNSSPPFSDLATEVIPQCPMIPGELGEKQNHWRLVATAEALILEGRNDHLLAAAKSIGLVIYEVSA